MIFCCHGLLGNAMQYQFDENTQALNKNDVNDWLLCNNILPSFHRFFQNPRVSVEMIAASISKLTLRILHSNPHIDLSSIARCMCQPNGAAGLWQLD